METTSSITETTFSLKEKHHSMEELESKQCTHQKEYINPTKNIEKIKYKSPDTISIRAFV